MMMLLADQGFSCPRPVYNIHGQTTSKETNPLGEEINVKVTAPIDTGLISEGNGKAKIYLN